MSIAHPFEPRELRRNSLKEELVALTEDTIDALLLNALIKCQARSRDREKFIAEERKRLARHGEVPNIYNERGWFYKKAHELAEEALVKLADSNIRIRLQKFRDKGWLLERDNPHDKWDKKKYYRVQILEIDRQMQLIGYYLSGWLIKQIDPSRPDTEEEYSKSQTRDFDSESRISESEIRDSETEVRSSELENVTSTFSTSTFKQDVENKQQQHGVDDVDDANGSSSKDTPQNTQAGAPAASELSSPSTPNSSSAISKTEPSAKAQSEDLSPEAADLLARLLTLGVIKGDLGRGDKRVAGALTMVRVCSDTARSWLDWLPDAMLDMEDAKTPVTNVGGFLAHCIRNGMPMPARTKARLEAEEKARLAREQAVHEQAARARAEQEQEQHAQTQQNEAARLDAAWDGLEPKVQARLEANVRSRLGVLGNLSHAEGARRAMRRTVLQQWLEEGELPGAGMLNEFLELSPIERADLERARLVG